MSTMAGVKVGPFGGNGGGRFDMGAAYDLVSIKIRHEQAINAIIVTYQGMCAPVPRHGGEGGDEIEIRFQPGEFLIGISGHFGSFEDVPVVVRSLTFQTSTLRKYGPYGKEEGTPFSVPVVNGKINGFFGRSGNYLDAIGVYVA